MVKALAHGYSSESTRRELSNEYFHDMVKMVFKNLCVLVLWTKVALALKGLTEKKCSHCTMLPTHEQLIFSMEIFSSIIY